ncbi:response regulator [Bacteroides sp. GM023]|uniref:hybrid sensor histidine kinase/response regulator n=1 Tax=Bacteroides sp. GM023 TaxID=2723058 RepID=UPI00168B969B|nr:response regulator [Bacteroides sp. GM023]MBD3590473.1 PAS domain-containing protein [Bacteroides sp. GM023]
MKQNNLHYLADDSAYSKNELSELAQNQLLFAENIYAAMPMSIEVYDINGVLRKINDKALEMYGVSDRETVINKVNLFESPYMDEDVKSKMQRGEEVTLEFEYDFERINNDAYFSSKNTNSIIYEARIVPVLSDKGNIIGYILLSNDVTSVKEVEFRTEESKKNLEMAMEAANMASWVYDVHKKTFSTLYGDSLAKETMSLEQMQSVLHPQDRLHLMQLFSQLINKETQQVQTTLRFYNREERQYRFYESRMRLSSEHRGKLLIIGTQMDVTEKVQMLKKTQDLITKRELAMQVSNIVHWDFDINTRKFESYNDPINDYAPNKLVSVEEFQNVVHPDDRSTYFDAMQSMLSGENQTVNFTCRIQTKYDTAWQYCNVIGVPFEQDENGKTIRYTGFRQNISKLHRLNEELKERNYKMDLTFKTVGMSYWDFDVICQQFTAFNDPVNDYHPETPISIDQYVSAAHPDDADAVRKHFESMVQGKEHEFSFQYRSKTKWDKEWQTLIITGVQVEKDKRGRTIRYTGISFNNTKWEKMAQQLVELKEKAELSDRLKSAFLANMSHEIRTPLNAIVGFSGLMVDCDNPEEKKEYLSIIESNNELLLRLINDILDLSKIESGILERKREEFNLAKVASELYTIIQPKITNPNVEFCLDYPIQNCWVKLDRNRLKQVWTNFLTNAVKCTYDGQIKMGFGIENGGIRFYVEDSGVGIPTELQDRVFGRFQKLNEFAQGTGLGLAISRAIVEGAGGKIGFTSTPGVGSTFWAWVPCEINMKEDNESQVTAQSEQATSSKPSSSLKEKDYGKWRILIAEDNDSNYSLVKHILKEYQITRVVNGVEAVEKVRSDKFDIVLMDMKMPIMGGLEATRKIRELNPVIPIIALTANAFDTDKVDAMEAGCNAFLTKPLKKEQLFELFSLMN